MAKQTKRRARKPGHYQTLERNARSNDPWVREAALQGYVADAAGAARVRFEAARIRHAAGRESGRYVEFCGLTLDPQRRDGDWTP